MKQSPSPKRTFGERVADLHCSSKPTTPSHPDPYYSTPRRQAKSPNPRLPSQQFPDYLLETQYYDSPSSKYQSYILQSNKSIQSSDDISELYKQNEDYNTIRDQEMTKMNQNVQKLRDDFDSKMERLRKDTQRQIDQYRRDFANAVLRLEKVTLQSIEERYNEISKSVAPQKEIRQQTPQRRSPSPRTPYKAPTNPKQNSKLALQLVEESRQKVLGLRSIQLDQSPIRSAYSPISLTSYKKEVMSPGRSPSKSKSLILV